MWKRGTTGHIADALRAALDVPRKRLFPFVGDRKGLDDAAQRLRTISYNATRFDIKDDIVEVGTDLGNEHPQLLLDLIGRARPPFPRVIIEWNSRLHLLHSNGVFPDDAPEVCAAIIEQPDPQLSRFEITTVTRPSTDRDYDVVAYVSPVSIVYDTEDIAGIAHDMGDAAAIMKLVGSQPDRIPPILMGRGYSNALNTEDQATIYAVERICKHATLKWSRYTGPMVRKAINDQSIIKVMTETGIQEGLISLLAQRAVVSDIQEFIGTFKLIISIMALLNAKDRIVGWSDPWKPAGTFHNGGRVRPFLEHRTVTLLLPKENALLSATPLYAAEGRPRRRHDVMGHWCSSHKYGDANCQHRYANVDVDHKECAICGHRVWWRKAHERGDRTIGILTKDYVVAHR